MRPSSTATVSRTSSSVSFPRVLLKGFRFVSAHDDHLIHGIRTLEGQTDSRLVVCVAGPLTPSLDYSLDLSIGVNTVSFLRPAPTAFEFPAITPFSARPQPSSFVVVCPAPHTHIIYR
jgi:hypothetical protein